MTVPCLDHVAGRGPLTRVRVVELGGRHLLRPTRPTPAGDEDPAVRQERRRIQVAGLGQGPGRGPLPAVGVIQLCRGRVAPGGSVVPTTRTLPSASSVTVSAYRVWTRSPVAVHPPRAGSYSSADAVGWSFVSPPTTSTRSSRSNVVVWMNWTLAGLPVILQCPALGSYSSAAAGGWVSSAGRRGSRTSLEHEHPAVGQQCGGPHVEG